MVSTIGKKFRRLQSFINCRQASIQLYKCQHGGRQICADPFFECACFMFVVYKYVLKNDIVNNQ